MSMFTPKSLAIISVTILSVSSLEFSLTEHEILKLFRLLYCSRASMRWLAEVRLDVKSSTLPSSSVILHLCSDNAS